MCDGQSEHECKLHQNWFKIDSIVKLHDVAACLATVIVLKTWKQVVNAGSASLQHQNIHFARIKRMRFDYGRQIYNASDGMG